MTEYMSISEKILPKIEPIKELNRDEEVSPLKAQVENSEKHYFVICKSKQKFLHQHIWFFTCMLNIGKIFKRRKSVSIVSPLSILKVSQKRFYTWYQKNEGQTKGQIISKRILVRFLGEFEDTEKSFKIIWPWRLSSAR